jgi:hypothetical protein
MPKIVTAEFCKYKNNLLNSKYFNDIKAVLAEKLNEINVTQYRLNLELIVLACNVVWNSCKDLKLKKEDIDKKQLTIDILTQLYVYTPAEVLIIKEHIDFIVNNKMIVIVKLSKRIYKGVWNWFKKKVL